MKTINHFDQSSCTETRRALEAALRQVSNDLGIRISLGRGTFELSGNEFRMKLTCNTGTAPNLRPISSPNQSSLIGLGTTFLVRGTQFTICKIHNNRPKYKFIAMNARGTKYKFPESQVRAGM